MVLSDSPCVRKSKTVLDSGFQALLGFQIPWAVFRIPQSKIPNSTTEFFAIPESGFPYMGDSTGIMKKSRINLGFWETAYLPLP